MPVPQLLNIALVGWALSSAQKKLIHLVINIMPKNRQDACSTITQYCSCGVGFEQRPKKLIQLSQQESRALPVPR
jgi:hypothetical protein